MELVSAGQQRLDFMTLLVTEMRNQNPLEPMDNQQMAAQLAQFTQLDLTEAMNGNIDTMNQTMAKMNTSFEGAMLVAQMDYAKSLLGKTVEFNYGDTNQPLEGKVNRVFFNDKGYLTLEVESRLTNPDGSQSDEAFYVRLDAVEGIKE
jgi:flagellar hook assembly protein FlgD